MALYKRGKVWWFKFKFQGLVIRESTHTSNREVAARAERERRRSLELGSNGLEPIKRPQMFSVIVREWLAGSPHWSDNTRRINKAHCAHLLPELGSLLLTEIRAPEIARYQAKRQRASASNRTINMEVTALRQILRAHGLWAAMQGKVKMMRVSEEVGRALSADEMSRLTVAVANTRSRSLPVALTLLGFTGMRLSELRTMRWRQVDLLGRPGIPPHVVVGRAKTKGSEGRMIPLGGTALGTLLEWRSKFPDAKPDHFVFPSERYGLDGDEGYKDGDISVYNITPTKAIGSWKTAWTTARKAAGVTCRTHDLRHTFVSRLAESGTPDSTLMALTGHLSRKMLELYSHTRVSAKLKAIDSLDSVQKPENDEGAQRWAQ